jgi:trehalose synthase-fused probable maltokinase
LHDRPISGIRIRCHGDYHLGQVLKTDTGFMIIDFEGEPTRPLAERRGKYSPMKDVTGMLRSFHYAAQSAAKQSPPKSPEEECRLQQWVQKWFESVSAEFVKAYVAVARPAGILPGSGDELAALADEYLLEKALYELAYELDHRPDWVDIPLRGILDILGGHTMPAWSD